MTEGAARCQELPTAPAEGDEGTAANAGPPPGHDPNLARIAVRSTVWVSLGTYLNQLIGFGAVLAMTRILSPEVFGYFAMATFASTLLSLRAKTGLHYMAIRHSTTDGTLLGTYLAVDLAAAVASLGLSFLAAAALWLAKYPAEVIMATIVLVACDSLAASFGALAMVLEKELQISRLTLTALLASIAAYTIAIGLALSGAGLWSLLAVNGVTTFLSAIGVVWVARRRAPHIFRYRWRFSRGLAVNLLRQGIPVGLSLTALTSVVNQYDNFLIGTFVGYSVLGYYDRAYRIAHWPHLLLTMVISRVAFVTFARVKDDLPRLTHAVQLSLWVLTTLGIPIILVLFFGARDVVGILYGPAWGASVPFLRFLTIYALVWPLVNLGFWLSVTLGHTRVALTLTVGQALTLIVLGTPLTILLGVMGTLVGVIVTMLLASVVSSRYIFRQLPLSVKETLGIPLLAGGVAGVFLSGILTMVSLEDIAPLLRLSVVCLIGPGIFVAILYGMRPADMTQRLRYLWFKGVAEVHMRRA